jgi:hypothetical protein
MMKKTGKTQASSERPRPRRISHRRRPQRPSPSEPQSYGRIERFRRKFAKSDEGKKAEAAK